MRITTPKIPIELLGPLSTSLTAARRSARQDVPAKAEIGEKRRERGVVDGEWSEVHDARALPCNRDESVSNLQMVGAGEAKRLIPYKMLPPGDPLIRKYSDNSTPTPPPGSIIDIFA